MSASSRRSKGLLSAYAIHYVRAADSLERNGIWIRKISILELGLHRNTPSYRERCRVCLHGQSIRRTKLGANAAHFPRLPFLSAVHLARRYVIMNGLAYP